MPSLGGQIRTFYPFICQWTLDCFHVLAVVNSALVNMGMPISFQDLISVLLEKYPQVELLDPNGSSVLFLPHCTYWFLQYDVDLK